MSGHVVHQGQHHHVRRSLPDMGAAPTEPPKLYPYHLLVITNYRLPADVDRCNLEVGLFYFIFIGLSNLFEWIFVQKHIYVVLPNNIIIDY